MPMAGADIEAAIRGAFPDAIVELRDLAGDDNHWAVTVTSSQFAGKNRVQQHKMVYAAIGEKMGGELHALQVTTVIPT
ncbi:ATP-binding protein [Erythrobacter sp. Dej080120_24]|jgi:stress-induced morphogen|uniref:BolA/IbaG family iron-sulfur metabolism protein n=1 Tax=Erythrobacter TaxID=1041 RepID=UPI0004D81599|nr:BolA/IbaG family iron-sulfur metabolism protein [Erythrobacter aurantius]KEO86080.1 ATP-binding protein [Erythrobacter sp. JL475]BDW83286.1 ATP-binding protein [Erythrobacter sp. Dej080120_24]